MDAAPINHPQEGRPIKEVIGTISKKNAVIIPVEVRRYLKIRANDKIVFQLKDNGVEIKPRRLMTLEVHT